MLLIKRILPKVSEKFYNFLINQFCIFFLICKSDMFPNLKMDIYYEMKDYSEH